MYSATESRSRALREVGGTEGSIGMEFSWPILRLWEGFWEGLKFNFMKVFFFRLLWFFLL